MLKAWCDETHTPRPASSSRPVRRLPHGPRPRATTHLSTYSRTTRAKKPYGDEALVYMKALADDLVAVGDGKGGAAGSEKRPGRHTQLRRRPRDGVRLAGRIRGALGRPQEALRGTAQRLDRRVREREDRRQGPGGRGVCGYFCAKSLTAVATYEDNAEGARRVSPGLHDRR